MFFAGGEEQIAWKPTALLQNVTTEYNEEMEALLATVDEDVLEIPMAPACSSYSSLWTPTPPTSPLASPRPTLPPLFPAIPCRWTAAIPQSNFFKKVTRPLF